MRILGLECSAKAASAAVFLDNNLLSKVFNADGKTHSETLMPSAKLALDNAKMDFKDVDLFVITNGPGSFTGLRIGLAAVKGLAFPNTPCVEVSTLECIAYGLKDNKEKTTVLSLMDARAGQFYTALFEVQNGTVTRLTPDCAKKSEEIYDEIKNYQNVIAAGDGAKLFCSMYNDIACSNVYQSAEFLGALAIKYYKNAKMPQDLACNYLRLPQAERERLKKLGK